MARLEIGKYLATDTRVCGGRLIFRGTRILVADVLELLAAGYAASEIARQYRDKITVAAVREAVQLTSRGVVREVTVRRAA
jgi:uncharacterized protein (DUF433 family)